MTLIRFEDRGCPSRAFAGPDLEAAVVPDEARPLLSRFDDHVTHYRVATSR